MKQLPTFILSLCVSLLAGFAGPGWADDTDIYLRQNPNLDDKARPNILFVFDNSGSMLWDIRDPDTGKATGELRIDVLRTALLQMLDEIHNVNIGFARFAQLYDPDRPQKGKAFASNAPITFPIMYIDANVNEIEGEIDDTIMDVSSQIARSENDAEENVNTRTVKLDDELLEMVQLSTIAEPEGIKLEKPIEHARYDAGEWEDGKMRLSDDPIVLGKDPSRGDTLVALNFPNLGIPQGATIQKAQIKFISAESYEADEEDVEVIVYGALLEDRADLSADEKTQLSGYFQNNNNYLRDNFPGPAQIATDKATTGIEWPLAQPLAEEQTFLTPDLKSVLQEVVNQNNWKSSSHFILLFKPSDTNAGSHSFYSDNSYTQDPPLLQVYWTMSEGQMSSLADSQDDVVDQRMEWGKNNSATEEIYLGQKPDSGDTTNVGIRFGSVDIPPGAHIKEAKITFTPQSSSVEAGSNAEPLTLNIYGEKNSNTKKDLSNQKLKNKNKTGTSVAWEINNTTLVTADLTDIIKEIISEVDWEAGNSMVFIFEGQTSSTGYRRIVGADDHDAEPAPTVTPDETTIPRLEVSYSIGVDVDGGGDEADPNDTQIIGLRFENVDIPTYAKIKAASIDFTSAQITTEPTALVIQGEEIDESASTANAAPFAVEEGNISDRNTTAAEVSWEVQPWNGENVTYSSSDLKEVVQEIVNHSGWCGGRDAMAFIIKGSGENPLRIAKSYDEDPRKAPVLNIEFDSQEQDVQGDSCVQQNFSTRISGENDDAEEVLNNGLAYVRSAILEIGISKTKDGNEDRMVGLRFKDVPIGSQAIIKKAELIFTSRDDRSGVAELSIMGEKSLNALQFTNTDKDLSQRPRTVAVPWTIDEAWEQGKLYQSVDISKIVEEITQQPGWKAYSSMAFFIIGTNGLRKAISFTGNPAEAPVLRIQVEGYLGEDGQGSFMTVRRRLKKITKHMEIPYGSWTPIVDGLYEAARYYRGQSVSYGKDRHKQSDYLVSHPGTYENGTLDRPEDCSIIKPYAEECAAEKIDGPARYLTPITTPCQSNHIVFLTDGDATTISAANNVRSLTGKSECYTEYEDPENPETTVKVTDEQACGIDLAEFLHTVDQSPELANTPDPQTVTVHAIGFQLGQGWKRIRVEKKDEYGHIVYQKNDDGSFKLDKNGNKKPETVATDEWEEDKQETEDNQRAVKFLKTMAAKGGGEFKAAQSAEELTAAFKAIVAEAMTTSTSFAAPSVSVNLFNDAFHRNEVYYALFKPDQRQRWAGNVKRFKVCSIHDSGCEPGSLIDVNGESAVEGNYLSPEARSAWTSDEQAPDGSDVIKGGAGEHVPPSANRVIYTYLGDNDAGTNHYITLGSEHQLESYIGNEDFEKALFGEDAASEEDMNNLVAWIKGQDVMDEDNDEDIEEDRWRFADPLHSSPNVVTYGGSEEDPVMKLFVGTNDGLIRMVDATNGQEEWAFLPQEMLSIQPSLMENLLGERIYGIDGTPTLLIYSPGDGVISQNDFVWLYMTMRRGGNNIYALDVTGTPKSQYGIPPKLMWTLRGGIEGTDYARLGQTWSRPKLSIANFGGKKYAVLFFGGGYHESFDQGWGPTDTLPAGGNAIYMIDAQSGKRLWWASSDPAADLVLERMVYPIPSELKLIDIDADAITDRIYVGDLGGQVWRIDLGDLSSSPGRGAVIADVSDGGDSKRRFFYPPEVKRMNSCPDYASSVAEFYLVGIVSGNRPAPLSTEILDQVYAFHDIYTGALPIENGSVAVEPIIPETDMVDLTSNVLQLQPDSTEAQQIRDELKESKGWYLNLKQGDAWVGEKGLASPLIIGEKMYFTTYTPPGTQESLCGFSEGESLLYHIDACIATALDEEDDGEDDDDPQGGVDDDDTDDDNTDDNEAEAEENSRSTKIKSGITSDIIPRFDDDGEIRATTNDPSLNQSLGNTQAKPRFWQQQ